MGAQLSSIRPEVSFTLSTETLLAANGTWTSEWVDVAYYQAVVFACKADVEGTLYAQFSNVGTEAAAATPPSQLMYLVSANVSEVHRLIRTRRYFRIKYVNGSVAQTSFHVQTFIGADGLLTSNLNSIIQQDSDAVIVRALESEIDIASGKITGFEIVNKFGTNGDIDTASVPEDIWDVGGLYTGFPDSTLETVSISSTDVADAAAGTGARTVRIIGLDTNYAVQSETITLNGVTPVASVGLYRRVHTATVTSVGSGGVNAGVITGTHTTTTANAFFSIIIGRNQSNVSAYTIPAGYTGYMRALSVSIRGSATAAIDGNIWTRSFGNPFRSRRPFTAATSARLYDIIYGGIIFTEKSDIVLRITVASANNTSVSGGYDLLLIKN